MSSKTVAIVEDVAIIALDLQSICADLGLDVIDVIGVSATATDALKKFANTGADILITDMELADGSEGVEVVESLRKLWPKLVVVFITATSMPEKLQRIAASNPDRVLKKPLDVEVLRSFLSEKIMI